MNGFLLVSGNHLLRQKKAFEILAKVKPSQKPETDPDTYILPGEKTKLEDIKHLRRFFALKPSQKGPKTALVFEVQNLTLEAQRNLLLLLKEDKNLLILTAPSPQAILPAFSSHSQVIRLPYEPEIKLEEEEAKKLEEKLKRIRKASWGEKIRQAEEITSREEAIIFCQKLLVLVREKFLKALEKEGKPTKELLFMKNLNQALTMLKANVNWRLAIENLFFCLSPGKNFSREKLRSKNPKSFI